MIKLINHEARLGRATSSLKMLAQFFIMSLLFSGLVSANDDAVFSKDDATNAGSEVYFYWYYFGRWFVMLFAAVLAVGNMLFSQTVKLHWGWALLIFVAIGMYGDLLFSKLAGFDLQDLKDSL
jgi:hypothetical protein